MSSSAPAGPEVGSAVFVLVLIVLLLARRTYLSITGARYSAGRLFGFTGFYLLLFAVLGSTTIYLALASWGTVGWLLLAPYAGVVLGAAALAIPHVRATVRFESRGEGRWYYRLPWVVPVAYLVLFVLRFGVEVALFGPSTVASFTLPTSAPSGAVVVLIAVDLLFGVSMGLLLGRAVGVYLAFQSKPEARTLAPSPPLPDGRP